MATSRFEIVREAPKKMTEQETVDYYLSKAVPQEHIFDKPCLYVDVYHDKPGYSEVKRPIDSNSTQLHRMICNVNTKGGIKKGNQARHYICNTPWCVEPSHLLEGTRSENMQDKVAAGTDSRGEKSGMAILTESIVLEIRQLYASGGWTYEKLGNKYGVHMYTIALIITRKTWKHLNHKQQEVITA